MDVNLASRLSGILLESDNRSSISFDEWFGMFQDASTLSDEYSKYLAKMLVKKIEPNPLTKVLKIQTHCVGETCSIVKNLKIDCENAASEIVIWLTEQSKQRKVYQCDHHCACDTLQLLIFFTNNFDVILVSADLLEILSESYLFFLSPDSNLVPNTPRCTLERFLCLVYLCLCKNKDDDPHLTRICSKIIDKIAIEKFSKLPLKKIGTKEEKIFSQVSDQLLIRRYIMCKLVLWETKLKHSPESFENKNLSNEFNEINEFITEHSFDTCTNAAGQPIVKLFLEHDEMLLKSITIIMNVLSSSGDLDKVWPILSCFISSIKHDESVFMDWLTSDEETAQFALHFLLAFFKLPNLETVLSGVEKTFFMNLLNRIERLWTRKLFPYNPNALLKYRGRFDG